jgi:hypothetical protein
MAGNFPDSPAPTAWREAVATVAERAKAALPECIGRIDAAIKIVLAGDVELQPDGTAQVASQANSTASYFVVNGTCQCKDYPKAPQGLCKHRLSIAIHKRATALAGETVKGLDAATPQAPQPPVTPLALPEAPASCNVYIEMSGRKVQLTLRDADETRLLARLGTLLEQFPAAAAAAQGEGWCRLHDVQMTQSRDGKHFYHKVGQTTDGKAMWCRGR